MSDREIKPGTCRECGCTELKACAVEVAAGIFIPCSWADESQTMCTRCDLENQAFDRAGLGIAHIVEEWEASGLSALLPTDPEIRGKLAASLVSAYLAGASEENDRWNAWLGFGAPEGSEPRNVNLDVCAPKTEAPPQVVRLATPADVREITRGRA